MRRIRVPITDNIRLDAGRQIALIQCGTARPDSITTTIVLTTDKHTTRIDPDRLAGERDHALDISDVFTGWDEDDDVSSLIRVKLCTQFIDDDKVILLKSRIHTGSYDIIWLKEEQSHKEDNPTHKKQKRHDVVHIKQK